MKLSSNKDGKKFNTLNENLGNCKDKDVFLKKGPYGHYLSYNDKNINLKNHLIKHKKKPEEIKLKDIIYLPEFTKQTNITSDDETYILNINSDPTYDLWYSNKFDPEFN